MPIANRSTSVRAKPTGLGQRSGDGVYDRGSNVAGPRADGGEQESLLAERRELGNNLGERKVESAWPGKATGRDTVNATISMRTGFLVVGALPVMWWACLTPCYRRQSSRLTAQKNVGAVGQTLVRSIVEMPVPFSVTFNRGRKHKAETEAQPTGFRSGVCARATRNVTYSPSWNAGV